MHAAVSRAVAGTCAAAGLEVPPPQAAFYVYPDFEPWRAHLARRLHAFLAELTGVSANALYRALTAGD